MDDTTRQLVAFAEASSFDRLPPNVVHECKRRIIDSFACAFGSHEDALSQMAMGVAARACPQKGAPTATVWGSRDPAMPDLAAFANGVMLRLSDLSDMYGAKGAGHPSDVLPGIIAAAEAASATGRDLIAATTLAYDVYCSLLDAIPLSSKGWDQPVCVSIATALAIGRLFKFETQQLADAVALSLTPSMALYQTRRGVISSWKGVASANASRNAMFAAFLAKDGFAGPTAVFDGASGFREIVGDFDWVLDAGIATPHRITLTNLKSFPICYHGQSAVWAAIQMHDEGIETDSIVEIEVETHAAAIALMAGDRSRWTPHTRDVADHSLPYVVARSLLDGSLTLDSFDDGKLNDRSGQFLMEKILVSENTDFTRRYPEANSTRLSLQLATGQLRSILVEQPKGHVANPMDDSAVDSKFRDLFVRYGDDAHGQRVLDALWHLEQCRDVNELVGLFARNRD